MADRITPRRRQEALCSLEKLACFLHSFKDVATVRELTLPMSPSKIGSMGLALVWVSRIVTVGLEMVLPGLAGQWLDTRFGTGFLALAGFALGLTAGIWHLIVMTRPPPHPVPPAQDDSSS